MSRHPQPSLLAVETAADRPRRRRVGARPGKNAAFASQQQEFRYSFGIEEEFFLSCANTRELAPRPPRTLLKAARRQLGATVTCEMLQSQLEVVSPVFTHVVEAALVMHELRLSLAKVAQAHGSCLVAAGTHPLGHWRQQRVTSRSRYRRLMSDFRIVGQRNLVCGLHVHVAVPEGIDRVDVMNRALRWLPLFLALSTSSPFWNGRATGLLSYRQSLYDEWPRSGLPDFFKDEDDYTAFVARMRGAGALRDASQLWWAIRPAARYPTLELRIADACTRVEDSVAIAALFRCLVAALARKPSLGAQRTTHTRRIVDENRWLAKRDGIGARFIAQASSNAVPVCDVLRSLLSEVADEIAEFECEQMIATLLDILERGTSAHDQLQIYTERRIAGDTRIAALSTVIEWLARETASPVTGR